MTPVNACFEVVHVSPFSAKILVMVVDKVSRAQTTTAALFARRRLTERITTRRCTKVG